MKSFKELITEGNVKELRNEIAGIVKGFSKDVKVSYGKFVEPTDFEWSKAGHIGTTKVGKLDTTISGNGVEILIDFDVEIRVVGDKFHAYTSLNTSTIQYAKLNGEEVKLDKGTATKIMNKIGKDTYKKVYAGDIDKYIESKYSIKGNKEIQKLQADGPSWK